MFVPHVCHGRFVDKYKPVLPLRLLNEFPNIDYRFCSDWHTNPHPTIAQRKTLTHPIARTLTLSMRIVRDSWSHDKPPHAIPRVKTLIRSQTRTQDQNVDQKGQSIFFTLRFPPQFFFYSLLLLDNFIIFPPPTPPPHFLYIFSLHHYHHVSIVSLLHQHNYHIYVAFTPPIVFLPDRPKRPTSGQNSQNQA